MENLRDGLVLSLTGLVITFLALGALILLIVVLERLFPPKVKAQVTPEPPARVTAASPIGQADDLEVVAVAIAAAVEYLRTLDRSRSGLGETLARGPGPWWGGAAAPGTNGRNAK